MIYSLLDTKAYSVNMREPACFVVTEALYKTKAAFHTVFHLISALDLGIWTIIPIEAILPCSMKNEEIQFNHLITGARQGSVLGPLLFSSTFILHPLTQGSDLIPSLYHCYILLHPAYRFFRGYLTAFLASIPRYLKLNLEKLNWSFIDSPLLCSTWQQTPSTPSWSVWHIDKTRDVISDGLTSLININYHILQVCFSHHQKNPPTLTWPDLLMSCHWVAIAAIKYELFFLFFLYCMRQRILQHIINKPWFMSTIFFQYSPTQPDKRKMAETTPPNHHHHHHYYQHQKSLKWKDCRTMFYLFHRRYRL